MGNSDLLNTPINKLERSADFFKNSKNIFFQTILLQKLFGVTPLSKKILVKFSEQSLPVLSRRPLCRWMGFL